MVLARRALAPLLLVLVLAAFAAPASATPIYTLENCFSADTAACAATSQTVGAISAVPSPDGKFVYGVADQSSSTGVLTLFTRSAAHGTLTRVAGPTGCYSTGGNGVVCTGQPAIVGPFDLAFDPTDPTGAYGYVIGNGTMDILARNPTTGVFTAQANCLSDTLAACVQPTPTIDVLSASRSAVFSPDGSNLYVASSGRSSGNDDGITRFSVGASHIPAFQGCSTESGAGACVPVAGQTGGTDQLAMSPADGKFLYSTGFSNNAIDVFSRNTTSGLLSNVGCYSPTDTTDCVAGAAEAVHPYALLIPPDDPTKLYVGTGTGVSVYARNTTTGLLTHLQCLNSTGANSCLKVPGLGIEVVNHLALSPDGTDLALTEAGASGGIVFLKRDKSTGLLGEFGGGAGCITADGTSGTCRILTALGSPSAPSLVHAAPNASQFYVGALGSATIAGFRADNPPVCANASVTTAFQTTVAAPLACSDPDGDAVTRQLVHLPTHGGLSAIDQSHQFVPYSPLAGFSGADSFSFRAIAHGLTSATATDTVTVGPAPPPPIPRITSPIKDQWLAGSTTKVTRLTVESVPKGATVKVLCKGKKHAKHRGGCTFSSKTYHEPNGKGALALKDKFKHAKLQPDTVVTVDITAPGSIGKEVRFTIRKRHLPKSKTYCFAVGSTHPHTHC